MTACMYARVYACSHQPASMSLHAQASVYVCVCMCVCMYLGIYMCVCACLYACRACMHACMHASCLCMYHARLHDLLSGRDSAVHMTFDYLVYVCTLLGATEIGGGSACVLD